MTKLKNKIVFITGASSGIGLACAEQFAAQGANVILTARRFDRINKLAQDLKNKYKIDTLPIELDVQNQKQVAKTIHNLPENWQKIDILVNNAGCALGSDKIQNGITENWDAMIATNINGLLYVSHAILPGMLERNNGHIVNIGSVGGHECYPAGNVYTHRTSRCEQWRT